MNKKIMILSVMIIILVLAVAASFVITGNVTKPVSKEGPFIVVKVIDGDTIRLNNNETVRFSGINTPEVGECYYQEAKDRLHELIYNKSVTLESDRTDRDKYNRILRYVYINGTNTNFLMVEEGYAKVYDKYKDDTKYYEQLKQLEAPVKQAGVGVWNCTAISSKCVYVASRNSDVYHTASCKYALKILTENLLCFNSSQEAEAMGYKFSGC